MNAPPVLSLLVAAAVLAALAPLSAGAGWDAAHAEAGGAVAAGPDALLPGTIVVADTADDRVRVFSPGGAHAFDIGSRGTGAGEFMAPEGAAISADGLIAVADMGNNRIQVFHTNGTFDYKFGSRGSGDGQLALPNSLSYSPSGDRIAVGGEHGTSVQVFHANGTFDYKFGSSPSRYTSWHVDYSP